MLSNPKEAMKDNRVQKQAISIDLTGFTGDKIAGWLAEKKFHSSISHNLNGCNGETLFQIFKMHRSSLNFLYEKLLDGSTMTLFDLAHFTNELEKLFEES